MARSRSAVLLLLSLAAVSCGLPNRMRSMFGGELAPIQVTISEYANEDSPLAVELIVVYDEKILDALMQMSARTWFAGREQFLRDHRDAFDSWKYEWTPGQLVGPLEKLAYGIGARRVVLFADYLLPGEHRATVDPQQPFRIVLGDTELAVEVLR